MGEIKSTLNLLYQSLIIIHLAKLKLSCFPSLLSLFLADLRHLHETGKEEDPRAVPALRVL